MSLSACGAQNGAADASRSLADGGSAAGEHDAEKSDGAVNTSPDAQDAEDRDTIQSPRGPTDATSSTPETTEAAGDDAPAGCALQSCAPAFAAAARSAGFSGSAVAYDALFGVTCESAGECVGACETAGGTNASCAAVSECDPGAVPDGGSMCLPPSYWIGASSALSESDTTTDAAEITLNAEAPADALVLTDFGISVPDGAEVQGIAFDVRVSADSGLIADGTVQVVRGDAAVGANRAVGSPWPMTLSYVTYGGPTDTWGLTWTAADVGANTFGISIKPKYTGTAGNDRAHVDAVRATVSYRSACE